MQISCPKCLKKFEVNEDIIPSEGRLLQCGSCNHKWFYEPIEIIEKVKIEEDTSNNIDEDNYKTKEENIKIKIPPKNEFKIQPKVNIKKTIENDKKNHKIYEKKQTNYFKLLLVLTVSFIALIILLDTFKLQISLLFPGIESILENLYETLKDMNLFFKDLKK